MVGEIFGKNVKNKGARLHLIGLYEDFSSKQQATNNTYTPSVQRTTINS
jgi:hypothetical protein